MGHSLGDEILTLMRCHSCGFSQLYKTWGWKSVCSRADNSKGIKGKINFFDFVFFLKVFLCFTVTHFMA